MPARQGSTSRPRPGTKNATATATTTAARRWRARPRMESSAARRRRPVQSPAPVSETVRFEQVGLWRSSHGVRKVILDRIDWTAGEGEHWGIVGPNGAGKTTLLRIASAQMRPSDGAAYVLGARLGTGAAARAPPADRPRRACARAPLLSGAARRRRRPHRLDRLDPPRRRAAPRRGGAGSRGARGGARRRARDPPLREPVGGGARAGACWPAG